jgi:two-component system, chemotaxis family, protein-glutamate methylesterase/glutaminase
MVPARRAPPLACASSDALIAIGASTGGVEALREVLSALPAAMPPIVIAQHMPPGYTETFAKRLDAGCELAVKEAQDGEPALPGTAYIAPGGRHLTVVRRAGGYAVRVSDDAPVNRHRPSVDTLFRAVASAARERAIAVMLTGMGSDGAQAMLDVSAAGGYTIAQDEASCVVFGMPRQAIALGAVREVLPLGRVARRLVELCAA